MPECARCGAFTDNPAEKYYHYCQDCHRHFDEIRESGVIIRDIEGGNYEVSVTVPGAEGRGGREKSQIEALARGKKIADEIGTDAIFEYSGSGSQWDLESYLNTHPDVRHGVYNRLSRVPRRSIAGLWSKLKRAIFG